jgi:hypothetical protein
MTKTRTTALLATTTWLTIIAVTLLGAATAGAQSIEITPTFGYRWGGTIYHEDNPTLSYDADLRDSEAYGLTIDIPINEHMLLELSADHQSTGLQKDELFAPTDNGFDLDINYYHIGIMGQWPTGHVAPFVVGGFGVAELRPDAPGLSNASRFSSFLGGGVKIPLAEHLAFRIEGRGYWSDTSGSNWDDSHHDCGHDNHHDNCSWENRDLVQGEIKVGLTIWF